MLKTFDAAFLEKYGPEGLSREDVTTLSSLVEETFYPLEISAIQNESSAMGFISAKAADKLEYDYGALAKDIAAVMDDVNLETENHIYQMQGLTIYLSY